MLLDECAQFTVLKLAVAQDHGCPVTALIGVLSIGTQQHDRLMSQKKKTKTEIPVGGCVDCLLTGHALQFRLVGNWRSLPRKKATIPPPFPMQSVTTVNTP
mgnify:CR=1 FL=1